MGAWELGPTDMDCFVQEMQQWEEEEEWLVMAPRPSGGDLLLSHLYTDANQKCWLMPKPHYNKNGNFQNKRNHLQPYHLNKVAIFHLSFQDHHFYNVWVITQILFSIVLCHMKLSQKHFPWWYIIVIFIIFSKMKITSLFFPDGKNTLCFFLFFFFF